MHTEKLYITPCGGEDTAAIQAAVSKAHSTDLRRVYIPAKEDGSPWVLESPIVLPNHITVILDGCTVCASSAAFVNETTKERSLGSESHYIFLVGQGGARIQGDIILDNVKDYRIADLTVQGSIRLRHARYGRLQQLTIRSTGRGIVLEEGCNNNLLTDLDVQSEEEAVLFAGGDTTVWGRGPEIYDTVLCRLLAKTGGKPAVSVCAGEHAAYNLFFRDITDDTQAEGASCSIGDGSSGEIRDISVRGVICQRTAVQTGAGCDGVFLGNLQSEDPFRRGEDNTRIHLDQALEAVAMPRSSRAAAPKAFVTPNDSRFFGATDDETIQNAINYGAKNGTCVVIPRWNARTQSLRWDIHKAIRLPSNIRVELWGCHLRQADFTYDNLFTNADEENENITITGVGDAVLDSGLPNGLKEKNAGQDGFGPIHSNAMLLFANVENLTVEHLHIDGSRWYNLYLLYCNRVRLSDIDFYAPPVIPDMGGVRVGSGCRDILLENFTGFTGADTVRISATAWDDLCRSYPYSKDIAHIRVNNFLINANRNYAVSMISHDGRTVQHVLVQTILDNSLAEQKKMPWAIVGIGSFVGWTEKSTQPGDIHHITVRDLTSRSAAAVELGGCAAGVELSNLHVFGTGQYGIQTAVSPNAREFLLTPEKVCKGYITAHVTDLQASAVFFRCAQASRYMRGTATSIITDKKKYMGTVLKLEGLQAERFTVSHILAERIGCGVRVTGQASVAVEDMQIAECGREEAFCGAGCTLTVEGKPIPQTDMRPL